MNINHNHILSLLQTGFTTIAVSFEVNMDSEVDPVLRARNRNTRVKEYTYKALETDNIKVGDLVVVDSPSEGLTIVQVTRVDAKAVDTLIRQHLPRTMELYDKYRRLA